MTRARAAAGRSTRSAMALRRTDLLASPGTPNRSTKPWAPVLILLAVSSAQGAILPERLGDLSRGPAAPVTVSNQKIWIEYGLEEAETAEYTSGPRKFQAGAYRLHDSTGALAAYDWQRPADVAPAKVARLSAEDAKTLLLVHGNYLLTFGGAKPTTAELEELYAKLPKVESVPLPTLPRFLPAERLIPNSERYVTGPDSLAAFDPGVPAEKAAFQLGTEVQIGSYRMPGGEVKLAIFSFPTPAIARERLADLEKLPGAVAKRTGPMVAVVLPPASAADAGEVLSKVRYQAEISWNERVPTAKDNIGTLIINIFILIGILLAISTVAGLTVGGLRLLRRRAGVAEEEGFTSLHLGDR
jgi:hypothetical protein